LKKIPLFSAKAGVFSPPLAPVFPPIHAYLSKKRKGETKSKIPTFFGKSRHKIPKKIYIPGEIRAISSETPFPSPKTGTFFF